MHGMAPSTLVEALAHWGGHEASGRFRGRVDCDPGDPMACVDLVLHGRSPHVARILASEPVATVSVSLDPGDGAHLVLADGRSLDAWIATAQAEGGPSATHWRELVERPEPPEGRVICGAELLDAATRRIGLLVLYDGWHRAAAWHERCRLGRGEPLGAYVVLTRWPDARLSPAR